MEGSRASGRRSLGLCLLLAVQGCLAKQILVGDADTWTRGRVYEPIEASVGDELVRHLPQALATEN